MMEGDAIIEQERRLIAAWLAFVQATHADPYTVEYLTECLHRRQWPPRLVQTAERLIAEYGQRC